uniref:Uncharacterized protein n=1 Tax=Lymantria dispar multicapsid nuclear polyhedrosis virus TaxID=10449 RepID=A0A1B1MQY9_NPVLD|nr:hypothetical protein [Lymantria dispar multiple nucleopolyhedrovirus]
MSCAAFVTVNWDSIMRIAAYTLFLRLRSEENDEDNGNYDENNDDADEETSANLRALLNKYLCPLFAMHMRNGSWAVCEDRILPDQPLLKFEYLQRLMRCEPRCAIRLVEYGATENVADMIERVVRSADLDYLLRIN